MTASPLQEHHQTFIEVLGSIPSCLLNEKVTPTAVDSENVHIYKEENMGWGQPISLFSLPSHCASSFWSFRWKASFRLSVTTDRNPGCPWVWKASSLSPPSTWAHSVVFSSLVTCLFSPVTRVFLPLQHMLASWHSLTLSSAVLWNRLQILQGVMKSTSVFCGTQEDCSPACSSVYLK